MNTKDIKNKVLGKIKSVFSYIKRHPFKSFFYAFVASILSLIILVSLIYLGVFGKIPTKTYLKSLKNPITSTIFASNKEVIGHYFLQNRSNVDTSQISKVLKQALIATEDKRFYEHSGIDYKSYARVFVKSILMQQNAGGGSTITQQVAKNIFGREKQFFLSLIHI